MEVCAFQEGFAGWESRAVVNHVENVREGNLSNIGRVEL